MKNFKTSKSLRLIAFFLVAVILICAFGFSADGWQINDTADVNTHQGTSNTPTPPTPDTSQNTDISDETEQEAPVQKYYNPLTGEETTELLSQTNHLSFVMNPAAPMYGTSSADLIIEFPIEDGSTRFLSFINTPEQMVKIGSLEESRGYISNLAKAFNSTVFASGNDDKIPYTKLEIDEKLSSFEGIKNYIYTEFGRYTYTSGNLVSSAITSLNASNLNDSPRNPFSFSESDTVIRGETPFNKIKIPFSSISETVLNYSSDSSTYLLEINSSDARDLINGKSLEFKNCFILFADSVTYEHQNSTQMILNTLGEGSGYYFTEGTAKQIRWCLSADGNLTLYDESSSELIINRGKSYISFFKSSKIYDIVLS